MKQSQQGADRRGGDLRRTRRVAAAYSLQPTAFSRAAFSLLEVLLATTVLIIIIMVISLVFRQMHNAWISGTRRADADTILRGIMGTIERDLTHAIDGNHFGIPQTFTETTIACVTLDGTNYVPQKITYTIDGTDLKRSVTELDPNSGTWKHGNSSTPVPLNGSYSLDPNLSWFQAEGITGTSLPTRVDIQVALVTNNAFSVVSGRCMGPDGKTGDAASQADDITAGE